MVIGICDDEAIIREELASICIKYKETNLINYQVTSFASGEELLKYTEHIDILFLDIQMKGMNGLETAEKIRETNDSMIIIFLTGFKDFMQEGYRVKAFRYILKPIKRLEFIRALEDAVNDLMKYSRAVISKDGELIFIRLRDILYVEYESRTTLVRTKRDFYESVTTMNEWENILNTGDFFRVHKAYIVNMEYIEEIGKYAVLENGERVEIAFRQIAKLKKACKEYRRRNAR